MEINIFADMHTHSKNSHDSVCEIEDMCISQLEKGTTIFAVTDHLDTDAHKDYDIYTPIKNSYNTVKELNKKYKDKCLLLSGVEVSEVFWHPHQKDRIYTLCEYDVIIGSVHQVRYKDLSYPYSKIDFSLFSETEIYEFLKAYFEDVLLLLETTDFDILAHLTCPIRYITGKYQISVDLNKFDELINKILSAVIEKGIALEINTSSFSALNNFMPSAEIIKKYHSMGGYLLTLGSDAHIAENASLYFKEAAAFLKETGFDKLYYYKERKPVEYQI